MNAENRLLKEISEITNYSLSLLYIKRFKKEHILAYFSIFLKFTALKMRISQQKKSIFIPSLIYYI